MWIRRDWDDFFNRMRSAARRCIRRGLWIARRETGWSPQKAIALRSLMMRD